MCLLVFRYGCMGFGFRFMLKSFVYYYYNRNVFRSIHICIIFCVENSVFQQPYYIYYCVHHVIGKDCIATGKKSTTTRLSHIFIQFAIEEREKLNDLRCVLQLKKNTSVRNLYLTTLQIYTLEEIVAHHYSCPSFL